MPGINTLVVIFAVALTLRAIFSFIETSITAMRLFRLKEIGAEFPRYRSLFHTLEHAPHQVLITTLIASNLADITAGTLGTRIIEMIFSRYNLSTGFVGFSAGISIATILILIFGEIVPKNLARGKGERLFKSMLWLINFIYRLLHPLANILTFLADSITNRLSGQIQTSGSEWVASEREIKFLINYIHQKGLLESEKTEMLRNIFDLGSTPVREIMIPGTDIVSISVTSSMEDAIAVFSQRHFTRLPVYEGESGNIIGMAHMKDIFKIVSVGEKKTLKEIIRPIMLVPDSMKINQLLREFRQKQMHIAVVVNEHGIVTGLITLEDVLEEIVGDISDEHELALEKITPLQDGGWLVDASIQLEDLAEAIGMSFEAENALTLGGFLTEKLQHLPRKGERILHQKHYFQIQKTTSRRIQQVLILQDKGLETPEA